MSDKDPATSPSDPDWVDAILQKALQRAEDGDATVPRPNGPAARPAGPAPRPGARPGSPATARAPGTDPAPAARPRPTPAEPPTARRAPSADPAAPPATARRAPTADDRSAPQATPPTARPAPDGAAPRRSPGSATAMPGAAAIGPATAPERGPRTGPPGGPPPPEGRAPAPRPGSDTAARDPRAGAGGQSAPTGPARPAADPSAANRAGGRTPTEAGGRSTARRPDPGVGAPYPDAAAGPDTGAGGGPYPDEIGLDPFPPDERRRRAEGAADSDAVELEGLGEPPSRTRSLLEWGAVILGALAVALLIKTFLVQAYYIPSSSMVPTLRPDDRVVVNKLSYRLGEVNRGDVIVFHRPEAWSGRDEDLIKRAIAFEGETLELRDGQVYIDNQLLREPYLAEGVLTTGLGQAITNCAPGSGPDQCIVPEGTVFVMGDNRPDSNDSRYLGPVPEDDIVGRAFLRVWPLTDIGGL